jgi:putative transposase
VAAGLAAAAARLGGQVVPGDAGLEDEQDAGEDRALGANRQRIVSFRPTAHRFVFGVSGRPRIAALCVGPHRFSRSSRDPFATAPRVELPPRATANDRRAAVARHDELAARHRAITLRLAGRPTRAICAAVGRSEVWFRKWWGRSPEAGPEGLDDLTRANRHVAQRIAPEPERAILSVRRRLQAHATPATRSCLLGATAILAELKSLGVRPPPCERTIGRVPERNNGTAPRVRPAPLLPRREYPGPPARASNDLREVDLVGPIYRQGRSHRYDIWVCKDAFDGAGCLRLAESRRRDEVLGFLGECWKDLGVPARVQLDNARELAGGGPAARPLSRVIRLCLRFGASPVFIPAGEPPFNGGVENFNGWFQEPPFDRRFRRPGDRRRELARLQEAVNTQHAHPRPGGKTPAQHRQGLRLRKLPASFLVPAGRRPLAAGRVTFIRRASGAGTVTVLSQRFRVGKRHRGLYRRLVVDTGRGHLTA